MMTRERPEQSGSGARRLAPEEEPRPVFGRNPVLELLRSGSRRIEEIELPPGARIGAIVREDEVLMAHHDTQILAEDHVIVFVTDKKTLPKVERLFQVGARFL